MIVGASLPSGWSVDHLEDVVRSDAPIGYGIVQPGAHVRTGVPVIAIRDLPTPSLQAVHRSDQAIEAAYRRSRVTAGDLLISVKGTTGRIGIVPEGFEGNISRDVARIRLRRDQDPTFWCQLLQSKPSQELMQAATVGTTRQELSIGTVKRLRFAYPPLAEQSRISAVLADMDAVISDLGVLILKKQRVMDALIHKLLIDEARIPGYSQPWTDTSVGDLSILSKGQQLGRADMDPTGHVPVWNGGVEPSGMTTTANVARPVVTVSEGGNSCGWVGRPTGSFWLGGHCYALDPRPAGHSVDFLYYALKAREPRIMALRVGSGLPNIQKTRLADFQLRVPTDAEEASEIASVLNDLGNDLSLLTARLRKSRLIKEGVAQRLLTGRDRLTGNEVAL